jgi:hypothetical protein
MLKELEMCRLLRLLFLFGLIAAITISLSFSQEKIVKKSTNAILFLPLAETEKAGWSNYNSPLRFPGEENDPKGFARYQENVELENKTVYSKVLVTHPQWKDKIGMIAGIFHVVNLPKNATFKAKVGFLKGASQTDGVKFRVFCVDDPPYYDEKISHYDGDLDDLILPLDRFAGKDTQIVLKVFALDSYHQDWAVWVNPRIEW